MIPGEIKGRLETIVGGKNVLTNKAAGPGLIVRPGSTEEAAQCLSILHSRSLPVVTLGGLTGLVGGTDVSPDFIGLSTERLNKIENFDPIRKQVLVGAGVKLQEVHSYVAERGLRYGVDFGARGSCTIGGNVATNAGGNSVVRFGMTRANVAGLEVVLADGSVISDLGGLVKNNVGYDLKELFIGSEGTLGVVTRALLKLVRAATGTASVLMALNSVEDALKVMGMLQAKCGGSLLALEIMWNRYFRVVGSAVMSGSPPPLSDTYPVYLLAQVEESEEGTPAEEILLDTLAEAECIADSALAQTTEQEKVFWAIRDGSEFVERSHRSVLSFDVSMWPQNYSSYVAEVEGRLNRRIPDATPYYFGHLADGNIHFMVGHDRTVPNATAMIEECVYGPLLRYSPSSISAEHGIGQEKAHHLWRSRSTSEIAAMNKIRKALDPTGVLNPHIQYHSSAGTCSGGDPSLVRTGKAAPC
jgi:FAD/FMN-containing dehydrogenase